eukprot:CAMPEP_0119334320 /NCGR_PEP_ID=MMETSP1333-20130426/87036_1 /TAXON_ID=418940 /ORGANISM="Scyphosphaera apsteinii, Strain RCC1455" /LENGTH=82 /DNA_ID=CAMNT_0007344587 /DNA_START=37 /DNA_END=282 /DNA_ORIENTATION=-
MPPVFARQASARTSALHRVERPPPLGSFVRVETHTQVLERFVIAHKATERALESAVSFALGSQAIILDKQGPVLAALCGLLQ